MAEERPTPLPPGTETEMGCQLFVSDKTWPHYEKLRPEAERLLRQALTHAGCRDITIEEPERASHFERDEDGDEFQRDDDTGKLVRGRFHWGWEINAIGVQDG